MLQNDALFYSNVSREFPADTWECKTYELQAERANEQVQLRETWLTQSFLKRSFSDIPSICNAQQYIEESGYDLIELLENDCKEVENKS